MLLVNTYVESVGLLQWTPCYIIIVNNDNVTYHIVYIKSNTEHFRRAVQGWFNRANYNMNLGNKC